MRRRSTTACRTCLLRPLIFLPPSNPLVAAPTVSAALTVWESIDPAVGNSARPSVMRIRPRSRSTSCCGIPRALQRTKKAYTAACGGKPAGSARHSIPYRTTYPIASTMACRLCTIGRPCARIGSAITARASGSGTAHSASIRSDG